MPAARAAPGHRRGVRAGLRHLPPLAGLLGAHHQAVSSDTSRDRNDGATAAYAIPIDLNKGTISLNIRGHDLHDALHRNRDLGDMRIFL